MAGIERMDRGHLSAEYRASNRQAEALGPYYKHQVWEKGKNRSRRVRQEEVAALREAIEGHKRFVRLAEEYVDVTVAMTREGMGNAGSKKNARRWRRRASRKPKGF